MVRLGQRYNKLKGLRRLGAEDDFGLAFDAFVEYL
jgi:hypothetical protein